MFSTTFKRPFVTAAVVAGLLIAAAPASAGSHQAATDGTSNTLINSVVGDSHRGQAPSGFSWSETQTGSAKTAGVHGSGADARGFLVDGPYSVKPASGFSRSESQTGLAKTADASGFVVDGPYSVKPASGFSWSETQTGSAKTASAYGGGADTSGFVVDGPLTVKPASGFSWSETQTGSAKTAGVHGSGADARGFLVDGPFSVKPASGFSWSESQTGSAKTVDAAGFVVDGPFSVKPASGFSWSETQTGSANSAGRPTATRTGMYVPTSAEVITTAQERGAAAGFKSLSGMDSETEFMDYTDDALLDSVGTTGLKFETEITDYLQRRTASGLDVWGLDRGVFSGDAYDNEMGITTQASIARPNSEIRPR